MKNLVCFFLLLCAGISTGNADISTQAILTQVNQTININQTPVIQSPMANNSSVSIAPISNPAPQQVQIKQVTLPKNAPQNSWDIVFVFRSGCQYCQQFDPTLMDFINKTGFTLMAFSTDGGVLPGIPYALPFTSKVLEKFHPDKFPAVYLANKYNLKMQPILISEGVVSEQDLASRIYTVLSQVGDGQS